MIQLTTKKVDLYSALIIAFILLGAYVVLFHQGITRYFFMQTQEKLMQENLKGSAVSDITLQQMNNEVITIQTKLDEFNRRLPKEENIDQILEQIHSASFLSNVNLELIEPQKIIDGELYKELPIKINLQSTFSNCYRFFANLENLPRILRLDRLKIERKADLPTVEIEMSLSAFMMR